MLPFITLNLFYSFHGSDADFLHTVLHLCPHLTDPCPNILPMFWTRTEIFCASVPHHQWFAHDSW